MAYVCFYGENSPFSNWYKAPFKYRGIQFSSSEQHYMWRKAVYFHDAETAQKILATNNPKTQKHLGGQVDGYNDTAWKKVCLKVMKEGLMCKFHQNPDLKRQLLTTIGILVEASPYDKYWGVGLLLTDPAIQSCVNWEGSNHLGYLLSEVREELWCNPPEECD
jgi:ribA/ribD-fused uncharacterized protein